MTLSILQNPITLTLGRLFIAWVILLSLSQSAFAQRDTTRVSQDTSRNKPYEPSKRPTFRPNDRYGDPFSHRSTESPLFLKDPNQMKLDVDIDTAMNYTIYEKIGDLNYRPTSSMSFEEFQQYQDRQILKGYWQGRSKAQDGESAVSSRGLIPKIFISPVLDRIFGGSYVELVPRGFVTLDFGASFQKMNNPQIPIRQQRNGGFEFDQQINMSVVGKVGEKLQVTANFDNNNSFDFQNNMKVEYTGFKEDILQKLEIGNVSLPLNNTLIQGSQNLFGVKAKLQFGKMDVTAIATTQRGKTSSLNVGGNGPGGGGQGRPFEIIASNYDDNRHFFLGHFFRDNYESWLSGLPQIFSGVNITRVEVYVLNRTTDTQTLRNVVALMDLGENSRVYNGKVTIKLDPQFYPATNNKANDLDRVFTFGPSQRNPDNINNELENIFYGANGMQNGLDFEKITGARRLNASEFTFHPQLGYITLARKLQNDEALAVSFQYTHNGTVYTVGELSDSYGKLKDDEVVFLKLLRPRKVSVRDANKKIIPTWDLMMKNIYNLNVTQLEREGFQLRIIYRDDRSGIDNPQLQEGGAVRQRQLIEILGLDRLNPRNDPGRDGNFDFVEGITVNTTTGQMIFPYVHPFSTALRKAFANEATEEALVQKYVFDELYTTTKADAELIATKNKFWLKGTYNAGSAKEILIPGFGVSQGSVKLFAGGIPLMEGSDYTVDYTFGKVTILNESILSSGKNIEVQFEQSDPFAFQTRSLLGTRFDYHLNEDVNLGSTFLYYNERPIVSRNQIGTEPARNIQYGFDFNVNKKSRLLTKLVDALPIVTTKEASTISFTGEFAQLLPGTSNVIDGEGTAYIDDFENSATPYSLMNPASWKLSSIPKDGRFDPTKGALNNPAAGYQRAKIAWYQIDNQFYRESGSNRPDYINDDDLNNHYVRAVLPNEIFPAKQQPPGTFWENIFDLAYYPDTRGPYNYAPTFTNSAQNWGGITSAIRTEVDFDKANIEYIEFWMMDPFLPGPNGKVITNQRTGINNTTGGQLFFQLGSISEDVARDGKHAFENGLPADGNTALATTNAWGVVTSQQYLTNAFDNSGTARQNQDVGFDGVPDDKEAAIAGLSGEDPSSDNFRYFLDEFYDNKQAQVLERYRDINGLDGNSPIITGSDKVTPAGTNVPDNEDLNADNTLSELEEYYQYTMNIKPGGLDIGREFVVDKIVHKHENTGEPVTWYLFRIPVRQGQKVGNIDGFKSIKYVRMLMTGFTQPVVLRLANFRMVGSRWRAYTGPLMEGGVNPSPETPSFMVSVVNLEENEAGDDKKSPYMIPPGVVRDRDQTAANSRLLNEQSVQMCVDNLEDGNARAIYKNLSVDLFNYGHIKMFLHANSEDTNDDELTAFLRLGTDQDQNYYEIEIPLKITNPANFPGITARDVWPEENEIDLDLSALYTLKGERDKLDIPLEEIYTSPENVGRHRVSILGRPDLTSVQVIMIGVRNPRSDDKRSHSLCLWANELRVTEFNRTPGWAVSSTMSAKLADFATLNGSLRYTSFGFGGVSSKIFERTREETMTYDVSSNVNVDKLIPGNTGIKIPMFVSYQRSTVTPLYDPANPDLKLTDALKSFKTEGQRENYIDIVQAQETRRSINFMNVRKVKVNPDAKTHLWDIENFSFSYSYSDKLFTDFTTAQDLTKSQSGSINYTFAPKGTGIEPFKDSDKFKSPWLKFIKDFNFNLMPNNIAVGLNLRRDYGKMVYRNYLSRGEFINSDPNYQKMFTFDRTYNLRWNLSKNLSLEYAARADAVIDEPEGELNTQEKRDSVLYNLKRFGRMKNFDQTITLNYTFPLDKFPLTDWIGADYRYNVAYGWKAGPVNFKDIGPDTPASPTDLPDKYDFKNTIQNNREQNFSGKLDMVKLYNKVKFLKDINSPKKQMPIRNTTQRTTTQRQPAKADSVKSASESMPGVAKSFFRFLMSLRSVNATYTLSQGTILAGFMPLPSLMGMDKNWEAPGWSFVLGSQDPDIRKKAAANGWLVENQNLTTPFSQLRNEVITVRANVEPSSDFKVQLDFKKERSAMYQEIYRYFDDPTEPNDEGFRSLNPSRSGSYRLSILSIGTSFNKTNDDIDSKLFEQFERNLITVRQRLTAALNIPGAEYDTTTQDVLIPAFIAAYTGKDVNKVSLSPFPKMPAPNWRVDYTGLTKISFLGDMFQSITLSHGYQSTYSVVNYTNSLETQVGAEHLELDKPIEGYNLDYFAHFDQETQVVTPIYVISQVMISEQFSPLIGINVRTKGRLTANFKYSTKRDLALNISNAQITELVAKDVSFELGYTKNNMRLPIKQKGRTVVLKNDVTFRLNTTVQDTKTLQRKIEELNVVTNGNINIQIRPNISYVVNQKLNIQLYFERTINEPLVTNSYRRATTRFGTQIRFSLAQ